MRIKKILKQAIGEKRLSNLKGQMCHYGCLLYFALKHRSKLNYIDNKIQLMTELSAQGYHVYRGYYDLKYLNSDGTRFLCHRLPINAHTNRDTKCEVGFFDLKQNEFKKIAETYAWCWQQGSRLRWYPQNSDWLMFNDVSDNSYCTTVIDTKTNKQVKKINFPLYDISSDCTWGVSLNYSRLQRLRPGYGYDYFGDKTQNQKAPEDDGLFWVDIENNKVKLIVSLKELADKLKCGSEYTHYLNHLSIAPDNKHFIFFHIYTVVGEKKWGTILYVYNVLDSTYYPIEQIDRVSHYCWIDDRNLMVTCHRENGTEYYAIYDIVIRDKKILDIAGLEVDGHPGKLGRGDIFITDTYPLDKSMQRLELFTKSSNEILIIADLYHDYRMRGEKRCDLHPSVENGGRAISVDTTYHNGKRSVVIFNSLVEENI